MKLHEVILIPLQPEDREQFILDNQWAFKYGAQQEFGMRDERCGFHLASWASFWRLFFIFTLIASVIGLRMV